MVALALTHHLSLSQGFHLKQFFSFSRGNEASFGRFYAARTFDGDYAPDVPDWYNDKEFTAAEENGFKLKESKATGINRITFTFEVGN